MPESIENFLRKFETSLAANQFVKLTLSNYRGTGEHPQKVVVRLVDTKKGPRLLFQYRYETRDVAKNYDPSEAAVRIRTFVDSGFRNAHLFTTTADFQLTIGKRSSRLITGEPSIATLPSTAHDRNKTSLIDPAAFYLKALGITTDDGKIRSQQRDKWKQINQYVDVLRSLFDNSRLADKKQLKIVDMGSGKGYLTFAAYDYFANVRGLEVDMTGVELRNELVDLGNEVSKAGGFDGLQFVTGSTDDFKVAEVDMLIALHACDTATDDALYKGIASKAAIIVAAPCCHKEIRRQMKPPEILKDILKHRSMLEREAETITDGLRSMLLEMSGYTTRVFEFVPTEHTPKNNMIVATRNAADPRKNDELQDRIKAVKSFYGIEKQRLENLLA